MKLVSSTACPRLLKYLVTEPSGSDRMPAFNARVVVSPFCALVQVERLEPVATEALCENSTCDSGKGGTLTQRSQSSAQRSQRKAFFAFLCDSPWRPLR